jgi:threonyl-tRNA synthetase
VSACDFEQDAFWHSSAHILGYAIEINYPDAKLAHGPPVDQGFFYDFGTL